MGIGGGESQVFGSRSDKGGRIGALEGEGGLAEEDRKVEGGRRRIGRRMDAEGELASPCDEGHDRAFEEDGGSGLGVVEMRAKKEVEGVIRGANFEGEGALAGGRKEGLGRERKDAEVVERELQAFDPCGSKEDRLVLTLAEFFDPGRDIASKFTELEVRAEKTQLILAADRTCPDDRAEAKRQRRGGFIDGGRQGEKEVVDGSAAGDGSQRKAGKGGGRQVFKRVDCEVGVSSEDSVLDGFGKEALPGHLLKGDQFAIALGFDQDEFAGASELLDLGLDVMGLPKGEMALAGGDPEGRGKGEGHRWAFLMLRETRRFREEWVQGSRQLRGRCGRHRGRVDGLRPAVP